MYQTDSLGLVSAPLIAFTTNNVVQNKLQLLLREVCGNYTDKLMRRHTSLFLSPCFV